MINHYALRCAQSKAAIAAFIGGGKMWLEAQDAMKRLAVIRFTGEINERI